MLILANVNKMLLNILQKINKENIKRIENLNIKQMARKPIAVKQRLKIMINL